jgi:hypothetical protein
LILTTLTPIRTFYIHYKDVHVAAPTHPDTWMGRIMSIISETGAFEVSIFDYGAGAEKNE